jgi:hypothetical protein
MLVWDQKTPVQMSSFSHETYVLGQLRCRARSQIITFLILTSGTLAAAAAPPY